MSSAAAPPSDPTAPGHRPGSIGPPSIRNLKYVPSLDLLYVNNAKAACSSIKEALWLASDRVTGEQTYAGNPHDQPHSPFLVAHLGVRESGPSTRWFSVVRNPYRRLAAAYLDKIASSNDVLIDQFRADYGWEGTPSLAQALADMASGDLSTVDQHFRPQVHNLSIGSIEYHHLGYLEDMNATFAWLAAQHPSIGRSHYAPHATGHLPSPLTPEAVSIIREGWREDFETFGYSLDPAIVAPVGGTDRHAKE